MNVENVLSESLEMDGALGAVAFVALRALSEGGASTAEVESTRQLLVKHFAALSDDQCNVLAEVAHRRLVARPDTGRWY